MLQMLCVLQIVKQLYINASDKLRRLAGGYSLLLRPLKFLWNSCPVSELRASILGPIVLRGILVLLAYIYLVRGGGGVHVVKGGVHAVKGGVHLSGPYLNLRSHLP